MECGVVFKDPPERGLPASGGLFAHCKLGGAETGDIQNLNVNTLTLKWMVRQSAMIARLKI